jgi:hypothetical protein
MVNVYTWNTFVCLHAYVPETWKSALSIMYIISQSLEVSKITKNKKNFEKCWFIIADQNFSYSMYTHVLHVHVYIPFLQNKDN